MIVTFSWLGCPAICNNALWTADVGSSDWSVDDLSVLDSSANLTDRLSKELKSLKLKHKLSLKLMLNLIFHLYSMDKIHTKPTQ